MSAPRNIAASVRARLTDRARARAENVQLLMTRYVIERLLYRIGASAHCERFILKGAMLFSLWADTPYRATGDLDLLGFGDNGPERLSQLFHEIVTLDVEDDGLQFLPDTLRVAVARAQDEYAGVRIDLVAQLGGARLPLHVDIGFGDAVTPAPQWIDYPVLLEQPAPRLRAYPPETVVAEKLQAMVSLGVANTRMKDFFDIWAISRTFSFQGAVLSSAIQATFAARDTPIPTESPTALTETFAREKAAQWTAFLRRTEIALDAEAFQDVQAAIAEFILPPLKALADGDPFDPQWPPAGPWSRSTT